MKKIMVVALAGLMMISVTACRKGGQKEATEKEKPSFKIGAIPDQNASELNRNMGEMAEYLSEATGIKVEFIPSVEYAALVTGFERGEIKMAWFGGLTGVQARAVAPGSEAIVQRPMDAKFKSVFITQKDLDVKKLEDLKGKTFTFGSESSTSGSLMPRHFMEEAGIDPEKDLNGAPNYSGNHDKTIALVQSGAFETGALNISVWEKAIKENKVDLNKVDVFYTTPEYFDYNWTINNDENIDEVYGAGTKENIKKALLSMSVDKGGSQAEVLKFFQTDVFVESKNDNYKAIEEVAKKLGMVK
ncbi:MAG: putative selenate ABC transporter substrate-binding protein [Clostridium sp.]